MRISLTIFSLFILSGCTLRAEFSPEKNELNDALVGEPYYAQINILGGNVATLTNYHGDREFVGNISPGDTGLYLAHCNNDKYNNNCVQIRGVPTQKGVIKVRVSGLFNVAMFQKSSEFDKTYTIKIKDSEGSF
ncbi:hypothetical protein JGC56_11725 [Salmonella enterica subsp. enterica serovar Saintpaul]|nr:hypothetical protein [Salmonella enterica subsp. enterica serovar Saintpaul]